MILDLIMQRKSFLKMALLTNLGLFIKPRMIYQVNTLEGNIQQAAFEASASFPHRAYMYFSELQTYWENEKQATRLLQQFQQVQNIFIQNRIHTQYRNYPDINFKNRDTLYYGNNYSRLQQVKNKYDPGNVIRHEQSIKICSEMSRRIRRNRRLKYNIVSVISAICEGAI